MGELHQSWAYGTGMLSVLQGGWHFNRVALASVLVGVVAIDGPLLQRASRVTTRSFAEVREVEVGLFANLDMVGHPTGFSTGRALAIDILSSEFLPVVQSFSAGEFIALRYVGCNGTCTAEIVGPGLDVQCIRSTKDLVIDMKAGAKTTVVSFTFDFDRVAAPGLITLHTELPTNATSTKLTIRDCKLRLSQVRYQVQLNNGTVQLLPPTPDSNNTIKVEQLNAEVKGPGLYSSTIGGLFLSADRKWGGSADLYSNGAPFQLLTTGETPLTYLNTYQKIYTWIDPTDVFIANIRELLFRTAIAASNSNSSNPLSQTISATEETQRAVYDSRYEYLAAAFAVMLAAVLATSSNLFGWWQLERVYSLGPFEVAKAFNAPFLKDSSYLGTSEKGFQAIEKKEIQYGEHVDGDTGSINVVMGVNENAEVGQDIELLGAQGEQRPIMTGMGSPESVKKLREANLSK